MSFCSKPSSTTVRPAAKQLSISIALIFALSSRATHAAVSEPEPSPAPESIEPIVVTSEKLPVQTLIDRKVYRVTSDLQSSFGTLSDIFNLIPSVDVDPDGTVTLRGDSHVLILIDGKPSTQLTGASAGENLQSIPAADIERIEILTTPPAEFKAEGASGVINVITRKQRAQGAAGGLQGSLGNGGRYILGTDGSYHSGPLSVSGAAGYRQEYRDRVIQSDEKAPDPQTGLPSESHSRINERIRREVPSVSLAAEYALNERQSVSATAKWADRGGLRTYSQYNTSGPPSAQAATSSRRFSSGHDPEIDYDEKLAFTQNLQRSGEALQFALHRSTSQQHEHYDYANDSELPPAPVFYSNLSFQENHATTDFDLDYTLPGSGSRALKLGYAFEQDNFEFDNRGNHVDANTGAQLPDPALTNDFRFRQQINAGYASYQAGVGAWTWLGGLRAELTRSDAQQLMDGIATTGSYFRVYPSLHVDRALAEDSRLSFGASRRVTRPDPSALNPYVDHEYTPNLLAGNPHLKPQFTQSYEVGYAYEGRGLTLGLTGYYRHNRDSVTEVTDYLGNGFSLTTKTNLPKNDSAGLEFSVNGRIVPRLSYNFSGNLFHTQIDATALGEAGLESTTGLNAKLKLDYRPTTTDSAQLSVTRTDKRLTPQGFVSAINLVNLGFKRQLGPQLSVIATVSDLFDGQRFRRLTRSATFTQEYQRSVRGRILYVGLVVSLGTAKKEKTPGFEYDQPTG